MIFEISAEEFLRETSNLGDVVDKIRIKSILSSYDPPLARTFSADGGYVLLFGKTAFLQGSIEDKETLRQFLYMSGISFVSGNICFSGDKKVYSVMKTEADETLKETEIKLSVPAMLMAHVFGYDFDDVYPDLCLRKRRGVMKVLSLGDAAAAIHITDEGNLLTGVAVKENERGKGLGRKIVDMAKNSVSGDLYVICEAELERFYEKLGFNKIGITEEIFIGD
jgi:GNAT superfamily N-acetyltransferase